MASKQLTRLANADDLDRSLSRRTSLGFLVIFALVAGIGGWAISAPLAGAIIASGLIVVDTNVKKVQHPTGGVVGAIFVKNGASVAAGEVVLRLDDTQARASLGIVVSQIVQLTGRKARLIAEREDADAIEFPPGFEASDPEAPAAAAGERKLFEIRRTAKQGQKAQLKERIGQLRQEIGGLSAQREAKGQEAALMREELARVKHMRKLELIPITRELATKRDVTRLEGELAVVIAQIARARGQISEVELQIMGLDETMRREATTELREIEGRLAELAERRTVAQDQLSRTDLKAPQSGIVHELAVHTVGGVIAAGDPVMTIVPDKDALAIEVRIAPTDIDQIAVGQDAVLRFSAFNQRTTPEVKGTVSRVAADLTKEPQTGAAYYVARIAIPPGERSKVSNIKLVPGMPVESFIVTGERTAMSYLLKPLTDQFVRAFREE